MVTPAQTLIVGELRTGRRLVSVPVESCSWSVASGAAGSIEATIPLLAADFQRVTQVPAGLGGVTRWVPNGRNRDGIRAAVEPTRMFAAVLVGDRVVEAGPIWTNDYDQDAGTLSIRASGLASIFDHRLLLSNLIAWPTAGAVAKSKLTYTNLSLGTIAKRLVQATLAHTGGDLPVVLPSDQSGTHSRTYPGYEMATVLQRLDELTQVEDGPEIAFEPRLTADRLGVEWVMRVGTNADPTLHQSGLDWIADTSATRGSVGGVRVSIDASSVTNRAFMKGAGTDEATVISRPATRAPLIDAGYPLLDSVRTLGGEGGLSQGNVDAHARADLASNDRPWVTWGLRIAVDDRLGQYRPGDWWQVRVGDGHVYLDPGMYRARLASIRGSFGESTVDLTMVPQEVS